MQVFFCDKCSRRVTEGELAEGEGVRVGDLAFCKFCCERPEVQEVLGRADEMMEAGRASESGLHRLVRGRRNGGRRTPQHGHRRVKVRTPPRGEPTTPRPRRPVSPVPSGSASRQALPPGRVDNFVRTTRNGLAHRARRKGGGLLALYGVLGLAAGFAVAAAAPALMDRAAAGPRPPRTSRGTREVSIRWAGPETTAEGRVRFEGECTVARAEGRLTIAFPSGGPWSVRVNGRVAYHGIALDGSRAKVGPAARRLRPGVNMIVATCESAGVKDPPKLLLDPGNGHH